MTIRNKKLFDSMPSANFDGVFDWDFLIEAFKPTRIEPMDIDAIIERNGYFLIFETKSNPAKKGEAKIPDGQRYLFEALMRIIKHKLTIFFVNGKDEKNIYYCWVWSWKDNKITYSHHYGTNFDLLEMTKKWFKHANSKSRF